MSTRITPLVLHTGLFLVALLLAVPALAGGQEGQAFASRSLVARSRSVGDLSKARPSAIDPIQGLYAETATIAGFGLFAEGQGVSLSRRSALYDVEGGAAFRIRNGLHFTASYRMVGVDLGFDSDVESADGEPGIAAPFIGLAFDF